MGAKVLYVSAEESLGQVRMRAERTGTLSPNLWLSAETDLAVILGQIDQVEPQLVIVDSVQTVSTADATGIAGGPGQVREVAASLTRVAKERDLPVLLVGHVTKDGQIAGPRVLEHLVDVVCHFEGDRGTALRFVRAVKNRFGPTDEVGCFEMTGEGIVGVTDPSGLFLSRAIGTEPGTCVTIALEGRRAIPVEVQALVVKSTSPHPRLVVNGVDSARVSMLIAVLQQHGNLKSIADSDVYVSTVGGVRLTEPAVDLAIALALGSAVTGMPIRGDVAVSGEISLAGEIRPGRAGRPAGVGGEAARLHDAHRARPRPPPRRDRRRGGGLSASADRRRRRPPASQSGSVGMLAVSSEPSSRRVFDHCCTVGRPCSTGPWSRSGTRSTEPSRAVYFSPRTVSGTSPPDCTAIASSFCVTVTSRRLPCQRMRNRSDGHSTGRRGSNVRWPPESRMPPKP